MQSSERRGRSVWHLRVSTPVLQEPGGTPFYDLGMDMYDGTKVFDDTTKQVKIYFGVMNQSQTEELIRRSQYGQPRDDRYQRLFAPKCGMVHSRIVFTIA
jgi:hypothetical protein